MLHQKTNVAGSTDSQFCGINEHIQFKGEIPLESFEGETTLGIHARQPPFPTDKFPVSANNFPVLRRTGNRLQGIGIAAKIGVSTRPHQMAPRSKKFPVIPCSQGIARRSLHPEFARRGREFRPLVARRKHGHMRLPCPQRAEGEGAAVPICDCPEFTRAPAPTVRRKRERVGRGCAHRQQPMCGGAPG